MAGLVGICSSSVISSQRSVTEATQATVYSEKTSVDSIHVDANLVVMKSRMSFLDSEMEIHRDRVHVWIDGEIYNSQEVTQGLGISVAETMLQNYLNDSLDRFLQKVDGVFVAIIYDQRKRQIHIVTDRYGLKIFYLSQKNGALIFAPELKCFPFFQQFKLIIREDVVDCFIDLEHMMGDATWFEGVEVANPSTVYSYSWESNNFTKRKYWSWSMIKPASVSLEQAAEEMGFLLDQAIKSRNFGNYQVGVGLSGGFDSRAILAAIKDDKPVTYTFGIQQSADVRIAREVASVAGVKNIHFDMHVDRWLAKRFSGVWKTDGMFNMYHMHYSHLMDEIPKILDVNLSGFLGDVVCGGSYLEKKGKVFLNKRIEPVIASHYFGNYIELCNAQDSFFDLNKIDPYVFYNRGRRMIGLGAEEANKTIAQRLPFMDNKLMDFSYSLPDEFRREGLVYQRALLLRYPDLYKNIPHATTGIPARLAPSVVDKLKKKINWGVYAVKYKLGIPTSFTDVFNWIKELETAIAIKEILDPKKALYPNFTDTNFLTLYAEPHIAGKGNYMKKVMGALTFEVWLQQIFNKKYMNF